jgi:putative peptide zinc metalloprotease protein
VPAAQADGPGTRYGFRPRARSGWSMKRMEAAEGDRRHVLRSLRTGEIVRMGDDEAALFELLDGTMGLPDLMAEAERRFGAAGIARLTRLLSELGERGFLEGVDAQERTPRRGFLARLAKSREYVFPGAGDFFQRLYRRGGFVLFTPAGLSVLAALAIGGLAVFAGLIIRRYGTPFVVASKVGLGGIAFMFGRFIVVAIHEVAHGLTMASFGRRASHAGVKLVFLFPFAFVDTSDGWFEPKRRRLAISAAGPVSDLVVGGVFSVVALVLGPGTIRDIFFQLAFAAYVGALFNLNPLLDRDGYHMLVDWLQQPGLRQKAREYVMRRMAGKPVRADAPRSFLIYGGLTLVWMVAAIGFVIIMSVVFYARLTEIAPKEVVWVVLGAFYLLLFVPVVLVFGKPLLERWRARRATVANAA